MDKDRIFGLFNFSGEEEGIDEEYQMPLELEDYQNTPTFKIGMFIKIIKNHEVFHQKLEKFFKKELNNNKIINDGNKEFSRLINYNKAWGYIKGIDVNNKDHIFEILDYNKNFPNLLPDYLNILLQFYEEREEYLKCAHLHKIYTILKETK